MSHKQSKQNRAVRSEFTLEELEMILTWSRVVGYQIPPGTQQETRANMERVRAAFAVHDAIVEKLTVALGHGGNNAGASESATQKT